MNDSDERHLAELDRRLAVVRDRVRGAALGHHTGFYLFGRPGTAKTYTVLKTLKSLNLTTQYHRGHLTPLGLFDLLADHAQNVIVLDDVSEIFQQPTALQILLAALGNRLEDSSVRIVKYRRQGVEETVRFEGGIVCISNLELHPTPLLDALKSRVHYLKYDPSDEQMAALMRNLGQAGWPVAQPTMDSDECLAVTAFLIQECQKIDRRFDLRLLLDKAFPDYVQWKNGQTESHWKDLVRSTLEEKVVARNHTPAIGTRQAQKESEQKLARMIRSAHAGAEEQRAAWCEQTGKSERPYYRRLQEGPG